VPSGCATSFGRDVFGVSKACRFESTLEEWSTRTSQYGLKRSLLPFLLSFMDGFACGDDLIESFIA
jgi:hypothetical protein